MPTPSRILILTLALFFFLSFSACALENRIVNGDFETGDLTGWTSYHGMIFDDPMYVYAGSYAGALYDCCSYNSYISQDVDLTGVDTLSYYIQNTMASSGRLNVYVDGVSLGYSIAPTDSFGYFTKDVSSYSGVCTVKFENPNDDDDIEIDNIEALAEAVPDYNSTSTGTIDLFYDSSTIVNEPGSIEVSVIHEENTEFDYHTYWIQDETDYSLTICNESSVFDFLVSFVESSPTTKTYDLYESYAYYDANLGYSVVENNILDTLTFDIVSRPDGSSSEIWSVGDLLANQSISFYYYIENYDSDDYNYYVSVTSSSQNPDSFRNEVFKHSGSFSRELLPGSYTALLEKERFGTYYVLDYYNFYIPETAPGDDTEVVEPPETPDSPEIPDSPEMPDIPEENGTLENNETGLYNSTFLGGYYQAVDGIGNFYFQPLENGFEFLVYPVNSLNDSVNSATVLVKTSGADMQGYTPIVSSLFVPLIASLPPKVQGLITYNLVWMLIIMIFRRK